MTKAERRQRARQKKRDRERSERAQGAALPAAGVAATVAPATSEPAAESEFITTAIAPRPRPAPAAAVAKAETRIERPRRDIVEDAEEDDADDEDEDDDLDDDFDDGDEEDEDEFTEDDALLNATCGAIELGDKFTWQELLACLLQATIDDPRLAVLVKLLADGDQPIPLSSERFLAVMNELELGDIVEEARDQIKNGPPPEDEEEEQELVRTTSKQLRAQSKNELESEARPVKASQLRERRTALSSGVVPSGSEEA